MTATIAQPMTLLLPAILLVTIVLSIFPSHVTGQFQGTFGQQGAFGTFGGGQPVGQQQPIGGGGFLGGGGGQFGGGAGFNPQTQSGNPNLNLFSLFQPQQPGGTEAFGNPNQGFQQNLNNPQDFSLIDWTQVDRRAEEGWWHLYPFGERYYDIDLGQLQGRPWLDRQIDLDFFLPYYGFRFNYTFVFPEGFIAMSYPWYIQPPYTFPSPRWPDEPDPSLIAAFMSAQSFMHVGDTPISHVWYRIIQRPASMVGWRIVNENMNQPQMNFVGYPQTREPIYKLPNHQPSRRSWGREILKITEGRVEDVGLLDQITDDIRAGMVGARGFTADYGLVITWDHMGYGGSPKYTQLNLYEQVKRWQNTYQMIIATDEIRSYCMVNYANINWTSSTSAGALFGRGGKQSAVFGFNGGNGTGFYQMPWSAEGNSYKLTQYGSTQVAGRWLARIDENIEYGGCSNSSIGTLWTQIQHATMLGGFALNVTGPCLRDTDTIKFQIDEYVTVDCLRMDMVIARCVIPVNTIYRMGMVNIKLSVDGGKEYNFWNKFYILAPSRGRKEVNLINDPLVPKNNWRGYEADNLTLTWPAYNLTFDANSQVDITLWGYWEDVEKHEFLEIGSLARNIPNKGNYFFNPRTLTHTDMLSHAWDRYNFGVLQVRTSSNWMAAKGDGIYWSMLVPFGWYFRDTWDYQYGHDWAMDKCIEWFEWDGKRDNFYMHLEPKLPCPCTLAQAQLDMGRYFPLYDCDMAGDSHCLYTQGAMHCVISTNAIWTGAGQQCCYDINGWLMFSQDWEYNYDYLRFYSAGIPHRAHPYGSYPYKRPPYVPSMSNFYNDLMPYDFCCKWAGHCELFYWRRETSGCQAYHNPVSGFAYGEPHFITYDGAKYTFNGKGYYVLSMMKSPRHDLMVQIRMEEPPKTIWDENVRATVITGVAAQDNASDIVEVYARKEFRDWRYKMDIFVNGIQQFFDTAWQKTLHYHGVTLFSPARNMNQSEIHIMFASGVGIRVMEARGILDAMVVLPNEYNQTWVDLYNYGYNQPVYVGAGTGTGKCANTYRTLGLLGTFNQDIRDDFTTPDCQETQPPSYPPNAAESQRIFYDFGAKWRVDGTRHRLLFRPEVRPIYNPLRFAENDINWQPVFDPWLRPAGNESLIFRRSEVRVACQGVPACEYDYLMTGRKEIALDTLSIERKIEGIKFHGEKRSVSCGPLQKNEGVIKYPPGNNYLDGVTVTFACKPDFFLHGTEQRTCWNGTWSPGWWTWCRLRSEENALKWFTGIIVSLIIIAVFAAIFLWCYCLRITQNKFDRRHIIVRQPPPSNLQQHHGGPQKQHMQQVLQPQLGYGFEADKDKKTITLEPMEHEPQPVGLYNGGGRGGGSQQLFNETSA